LSKSFIYFDLQTNFEDLFLQGVITECWIMRIYTINVESFILYILCMVSY